MSPFPVHSLAESRKMLLSRILSVPMPKFLLHLFCISYFHIFHSVRLLIFSVHTTTDTPSYPQPLKGNKTKYPQRRFQQSISMPVSGFHALQFHLSSLENRRLPLPGKGWIPKKFFLCEMPEFFL